MSSFRSAVLLDVDGTLTDTNHLHALAWQRAFRDHGHDVAAWRILRLIGASGSRLMAECIGESDSDEHHVAVKESWRAHFDRLVPEIRPFPGAVDLIGAVRDTGTAAVLATSSPEDLIEHHLDALGLTEADVDAITTDDDVEEAKPAPDVFEAALDAVGVEAERAIVIGDTVWDIDAATAAGIRTVAVRTGGWSADELSAAGAIEVHDDVGALLDDRSTSALGDLLAG